MECLQEVWMEKHFTKFLVFLKKNKVKFFTKLGQKKIKKIWFYETNMDKNVGKYEGREATPEWVNEGARSAARVKNRQQQTTTTTTNNNDNNDNNNNNDNSDNSDNNDNNDINQQQQRLVP